ncbi:MAG: manganese efflux pump MntP family protein [bacterium]
MSFSEILLLALALAADAFSVGAVVGLRHRGAGQIFRLSFSFGFFQSLMSFAGIAAGAALASRIGKWDHWLAFALLAAIGTRMIYNSFTERPARREVDPTTGIVLLALSVAVSIDALAAGIGLGAARAPVAFSVATIGLVASAATIASMRLAGRIQARFGSRCEFAAGVVLIGIGVKILLGHILAASP